MIKHLTMLLLVAGFYTGVRAQTFEPAVNNVSSGETEARIDRKSNSIYNGTVFSSFTGMTEQGKQVNNEMLRSKVSLLVFWTPYCGCYNFHWLDTVVNTFRKSPRFQIVVLGSTISGLAEYRREHYMPYEYIALGSEGKMHELNFNNGFTSFVLVDGSGVAVKVGINKNPAVYLDEIRKLLTQ